MIGGNEERGLSVEAFKSRMVIIIHKSKNIGISIGMRGNMLVPSGLFGHFSQGLIQPPVEPLHHTVGLWTKRPR
jgi:hypothetical protein